MEVLRIDVIHEVWLLVELVHVEVLDTDADLAGLLDVELVRNEGEVGVHKLHERADDRLELVARVEKDLNPANLTLGADVVPDRAVDLPLVEDGNVDGTVQKTSLKLHHLL